MLVNLRVCKLGPGLCPSLVFIAGVCMGWGGESCVAVYWVVAWVVQ